MRVAINALGVNGGGGKTYLEHVLPALEEIDSGSEYFVVVRASARNCLPPSSDSITYVPANLQAGLLDRIILEQAWLPVWLRKNKIDLLYSPADSTSLLAPCPVVLAMRNMNLYVKRDKGWSLPFESKFLALSAFARVSARIARKIIFVSQTSGGVISTRLKIAPEKKRIVYHGVNPAFFEPAKNIPKRIEWLKSKSPYILSVSSIYRFKNYVRLIEAFGLYRKEASRDHHLVIAGYPFDKPYYRKMKDVIAARGLESRVFLANEVDYADLPALYQNAALFAFPSYLETFGHPLVEAMASGTPIVAADIENSREITEEAAAFFEPRNVKALAGVLKRVLEDSTLRSQLSEKAKARAKNFSWKRCARETREVFLEALS